MNDPTNRPVSDWLADLDASDADLAAGRIVPGEVVMARLQAALERYEATRRGEKDPRVASHR